MEIAAGSKSKESENAMALKAIIMKGPRIVARRELVYLHAGLPNAFISHSYIRQFWLCYPFSPNGLDISGGAI